MSFSWKSNGIASMSPNIPTIALPLPAFKGGSGLNFQLLSYERFVKFRFPV